MAAIPQLVGRLYVCVQDKTRRRTGRIIPTWLVDIHQFFAIMFLSN